MKHTLIILLGCCLGLNSCNDLDLNPLSQASSENWYSNETEIEMSVKGSTAMTSGRWTMKIKRTISFIGKLLRRS